MYHVIETISTVSLLYILSLFFCRLGFYSLVFHRKLWNSLLTITFLLTALAGIFMALQINFKWNIPIVKYILKWHVETGLALAVTGIFHFLWHLSYFGKIFSKTEKIFMTEDPGGIDSPGIIATLFVLGFTGSSVQILLMREIMNISGGYELITGLFLGSWLIASAGGAALATRSYLNDIPKISLIFSVSPIVSLLLLIILSRLFLQPGEIPSLLVITIITFLFLVPFCLVSGFAFVKLIIIASWKNNLNPGRSFSIETTGGIFAGILLSVLTSGWINTYLLFFIITFLTIAYTFLTYYAKYSSTQLIVKILFSVLLTIIILAKPDRIFRQLLLPGIKVTDTKDTPYGNITRGRYSGEETIYYNQRLMAYSDDAIEREEDVHYALLQRANPVNIVLISGSLESHLPEILKYPVKNITYIERDPALAKLHIPQTISGSAHLTIENRDAFRYIRGRKEQVDAVILLLPPPSTLSLNRFYTTEFFSDVKKLLSGGGIFMCSPGPGENYLNKEAVNLYSSVYNSLTSVFRFVKPVVGNKLYLIASDRELSVSFCRLAEERGIKNIYVSSDYLDDGLTERKSVEVISLLNPAVKLNRLAFPISCLYLQNYDFSKNLNEKIPAILIIIVAFAVPVLSVRKRDLLMYFSASALAGFEIIILLTIQLTVGNMYEFTGIILAALMAGLATGAGINHSFLNSISLKRKTFFLIIYYSAIALLFNFIVSIKEIPVVVILIVFSVLIPSCLTVHLFRELTVTNNTETSPGKTYGADLAGSALGLILMSGVAVPLLGIRVSIFLLAALIFTGFLFGRNRNKC